MIDLAETIGKIGVRTESHGKINIRHGNVPFFEHFSCYLEPEVADKLVWSYVDNRLYFAIEARFAHSDVRRYVI